MSKKALDRIRKQHKAAVLDAHDRLGNETLIVKAEAIREICIFARDDEKLRFDMLVDLTAVDYLNRSPRFEVVYHLYSVSLKHRLRLRAPLDGEAPEIDTVSDIWRSANWAERETWDMFGIRFRNHPDLRRILLYEEFEGHPLRKDYPVQRSQPRMDLRRSERDAVEEYKVLHVGRGKA
jgi:NADH-quinone oxidoreductase subunit C